MTVGPILVRASLRLNHLLGPPACGRPARASPRRRLQSWLTDMLCSLLLPPSAAAFALAFLGYEARTGLNPTQNVADIVKIWCALFTSCCCVCFVRCWFLVVVCC